MRHDVTVSPVNHPRYSHRVRFPGPDGKTFQRWFTTKTEAELSAKKLRKEIGREGSAFGVLSDDEKAAVQFWRGFAASVPDAPPPALLVILQRYSEQWKATRSSVIVAAAVESYQAAKSAEGLRPVSLQAIRTRCRRFAHDFGDRQISSITSAEISDWILTLAATRQPGASKAAPKAKAGKSAASTQVGLLSKRNHRLALSGLFSYAKTRGWVQENPVTDAARPRPPKTRPGVLHPGEVARLFSALGVAAPALVPFWAVRFFAGVREQEVLRMDWSMIDLTSGEIHLPDTVTKTGHSRTVRIEPVLGAFLAPYVQSNGGIVTSSTMGRVYHLKKALSRLRAEDVEAAAKAKTEGVEPPSQFPSPMPANAARHSFATYHLLAFRHAGETSLQLGHGGSPEMLHRHYKGIASETEAKAFWEIRPTRPSNVVPMEMSANPVIPKPKARRREAK
jgi:integrase